MNVMKCRTQGPASSCVKRTMTERDARDVHPEDQPG
jgi:hypothetical protein